MDIFSKCSFPAYKKKYFWVEEGEKQQQLDIGNKNK